MSANGISHLALKRDRQDAKLALAATDRTAAGNPRDTLDITQLPTRYHTSSNKSGDSIDNPNIGGLVDGRPWT